MKKALVVAGLAAAAAPALSEGTVTVAGIVDAAVRSVDNQGVGSMQSLVSGSNATSRLIVRGAEDLGGGLTAGFHLEHGIALDTGVSTSAAFWDRRSTVSIARTGLGEVRLGRDYVPSYNGWSRFDPFNHVGAAGSNNSATGSQVGPIRSAFGTTANTTTRTSNSVGYFLPAGLGGFEGQLMVAAGEGQTPANGGAKVVGGRLGWARGLVVLSLVSTRTETDFTTSGAFDDTAVGGTYNFGTARVNLAWRQFKQASAKQTKLMLSGTITVGPGRRGMPRFEPANWAANLALRERAVDLACEAGFTLAQLSLAWVLSRGDHVLAIPGTTNPAHLRENLAVVAVTLSPAVIERLDAVVNERTVSGDRYGAQSSREVDT